MTNLYNYSDYKSYLKDYVNEQDSSWGLLTKMAEASGCQRAYLSRCLNQEVHLTMDHACNLASFLKLNETETEYFLILVELARAASKTYRDRLEKKLARIRHEVEELQKSALRPPPKLNGGEILYYASWIPAAIHILTSIEKFQTITSISEKLNLDKKTTEMFLQQLVAMKLIIQKGSQWKFNSGEMHLNKDSPLNSTHLNNWRQKAIMNSQFKKDESIHYTVIQSLDESAYQEIRKAVVKIIADFAKIAGPAPSEQVACLNIDIFKV